MVESDSDSGGSERGEGLVTSGELSVCVCDRSRAALPTVLLATNMAAAATL